MNEVDALNYANRVVRKINEILEDIKDKPTRFSLKKKAERAYLLASKKVFSAINEKYFGWGIEGQDMPEETKKLAKEIIENIKTPEE